MSAPERSGGRVRAGAGALVLGFLPVAIFFVLNALRPDLMAQVLESSAGSIFARTIFGLSALSAALYLWASLGTFGARWAKTLLIILTASFLTVPAVLITVFGPIVFAFMNGS